MAHLQDVGDTPWVRGGTFVGSKGKGRRLEGFAIELTGTDASRYDVYYIAHLHETGNTQWYKNGQFCGTRRGGIPVQAIAVFIADRSAPTRGIWFPAAPTTSVSHYPNCVRLLNVGGFLYSQFDYRRNIRNTSPRGNPTNDLYLYLVAASVKDNGESSVRDPADIGLHVRGGRDFDEEFTQTKLYGHVYSGDESNGEHKWEWEDHCTVRYNNFVIMNVSQYRWEGIRLFAREGDHGLTSDDVVFNALIRLSDIDSSGRWFSKVEGDCDIPGDCATLYFAIRPWGGGDFWQP
jgi:hypothetical protein